MRVLASRSAAKTLSEKIVLLLNREGWSEVATECIISLTDLRMHFSQVVERFGTWRGLGAYCTPSSVFEKFRVPFPLLLFPWTDFHKCFNFFPHSFRNSNYFLFFYFEILREKYVIQARPSKIDSLVHVRRLAAMLHIPYSYFPKCFLRSSLA